MFLCVIDSTQFLALRFNVSTVDLDFKIKSYNWKLCIPIVNILFSMIIGSIDLIKPLST